jgi:enamine deaminase RidA (YjgF/YER057c/UK114 family)
MNEAYAAAFPEDPPARSSALLGIASPGLKVAIDAIAVYEPRRED